MTRTTTTLTELARLGFSDLGWAGEQLAPVPADIVPLFALAADPDQALRCLLGLLETAPDEVAAVLADEAAAGRLLRVLGASEGLATFLSRHPEHLDALRHPIASPAGLAPLIAQGAGEKGWNALRVA